MDMTEPIPSLLEKAASQGFSIFLLVLGIYFIVKQLLKVQQSADSARDLRVTDLKERISVLETKVNDCEKDRAELWKQLAQAGSLKNMTSTPVPPAIGVTQ